MSEYTAIVQQSGDWWIGWIEEVPGVNCQERTREELIETLHVTLQEALAANRADARLAAATGFEEVHGSEAAIHRVAVCHPERL